MLLIRMAARTATIRQGVTRPAGSLDRADYQGQSWWILNGSIVRERRKRPAGFFTCGGLKTGSKLLAQWRGLGRGGPGFPT